MILMKHGIWVGVDESCTMAKLFSYSQSHGQGQVHVGPKVVKYGPTPDR